MRFPILLALFLAPIVACGDKNPILSCPPAESVTVRDTVQVMVTHRDTIRVTSRDTVRTVREDTVRTVGKDTVRIVVTLRDTVYMTRTVRDTVIVTNTVSRRDTVTIVRTDTVRISTLPTTDINNQLSYTHPDYNLIAYDSHNRVLQMEAVVNVRNDGKSLEDVRATLTGLDKGLTVLYSAHATMDIVAGNGSFTVFTFRLVFNEETYEQLHITKVSFRKE